MAIRFRLDRQEFGLMKAEYGMGAVAGFPEIVDVQEDEDGAGEAQRTLMGKRYLVPGEEGRWQIPIPLLRVFQALRGYESGFSGAQIQDGQMIRKFVFYFHRGRIFLVERTEGHYDLMEYPSVEAVIGAMANRIRNFRNKKTQILEATDDPQEAAALLVSTSVERNWIFSGWTRTDDPVDCLICVLETAEEQVMLEQQGTQARLLKPDRIDFMRALARWMERAGLMDLKKTAAAQQEEVGA